MESNTSPLTPKQLTAELVTEIRGLLNRISPNLSNCQVAGEIEKHRTRFFSQLEVMQISITNINPEVKLNGIQTDCTNLVTAWITERKFKGIVKIYVGSRPR